MLRRWLIALLLAAFAQPLSAADRAAPIGTGPALSTVKSTDGTDLLVAQAGNPGAPAILFIHGFAQSYLSFRRQFGSDLAKHFHIVAFDLRGHGGSAKPSDPTAYTDVARSADDVAAVIRATGLHRPVIVGWSYGGIVVGDYVRKYGIANVSAVVFAGTLGGLLAPVALSSPPASAHKANNLIDSIKKASAQSRSLDLAENIAGGDVISRAYTTPAMSDSDLRILFATEMMLPAYVRRALAHRSNDNSDLVGVFATLPTLFVRGEFDLGMGEAEMALLAPRLPKMKLSRYARTGHLTFFEAADRFNTELVAFATAAPPRAVDPAASVPRPTLPMTAAAHRTFRDREFAARDTNGNGVLEPSEIEAASGGPLSPEAIARGIRINCGADLPNCPLARFREQGDAEFQRVDHDHDGVVTLDELKAAGGSFHLETP